MRPIRLIAQIFPAVLLVALLALLASTVYTTRELHTFYVEQTAAALESDIRLLLPQLDLPGPAENLQMLCRQAGQRTGIRFTVIAPDGRVLADSLEDPARMENHGRRPEVAAALRGARSASAIRFSNTRMESQQYVALPLLEGRQIRAVIRAARPVRDLQQTLDAVTDHIVLSVVVIAALAAGLSLYLSWRLIRPLKALQSTAEHFARGDFEHRLPSSRTVEIAGLADSMKRMARQLDERIQTVNRQRVESEAVLACMSEGVLAVNHDHVVIRINRAAGDMLEVAPEAALGRNLVEIVRNPALQAFVAQALHAAAPIEQALQLYGRLERFVQAHGTVLQDAAGRRIGALVVLNNITRLHRLEDQQREFVANVSHELKTPITAIKGFVETLLSPGDHKPEDAQRFLAIVQRHSARLDTIIDDLLALSRIEQDEEQGALERAEADWHDVVDHALQLCRARASSKEIVLENRCIPPLPARVNVRLLEQALVNLLDNAIQYSPPGQVVSVEAQRQAERWVIVVRDHGCGIAAEHLPHLFERFYRVDKARSRSSGGTGLGLAIVKHILQAHGGGVTVESQPGQGSTFSIWLPA
ncbi:MAG: ATP-binding protein [Kiritimatiellaeota bacterium]|nr:ATP-binding protein [Kiritimatiellota bacterium]